MSELRGLGAVHDELKRLGGRLLAVSADPPTRSYQVVERQQLSFPILADEKREAIRAYGVLHEKGAPDGSDIAIPAMFLIDPQGRIVWRRVAARIQDRPDPRQVIAEIRKHFGG